MSTDGVSGTVADALTVVSVQIAKRSRDDLGHWNQTRPSSFLFQSGLNLCNNEGAIDACVYTSDTYWNKDNTICGENIGEYC